MRSVVCCILLSVFCTIVSSDDIILQKRFFYPSEVTEDVMDPKRKKPFCNAFTGCGRKRSDMGALVDMSQEPAVEELTKQILSQAKLWEAIQEARQEILQQKHNQQLQQQQQQLEKVGLRPYPMLGGNRKRRSAKPVQHT